MTNEAVRITVIIAMIMLFVGFVVGIVSAPSSYKKDTYDCTVKCPGNSHSIKFNQVCYCEVK